MPQVMNLRFDSVDKARFWFSFFQQAQVADTVCNPAFVSSTGLLPTGTSYDESHILIDIAARDAVCPTVSRTFEAKEQAGAPGWPMPNGFYVSSTNPNPRLMNSNAGKSVGEKVNCYDPDSGLRGRYTWNGTAWSDQQPIVDKCWPDTNHSERILEILLGSWIKSYPYPPGSSQHMAWRTWEPPNYPANNDWRNVKVTIDMRCKDLYLGIYSKICQHIQGDLPHRSWCLPKTITFNALPVANDTIIVNGSTFTFKTVAPGLSDVLIGANVNECATNLHAKLSAPTMTIAAVKMADYKVSGPTVSVMPKSAAYTPAANTNTEFIVSASGTFAAAVNPHHYPNYILTRNLISDQLGFGQDSWGKRNKVPMIEDSGRVQVELNYTTNEADWECMAGFTVDRRPSYFRYAVAPIAEILKDLRGNSYMVAVHPRPQPDASAFSQITPAALPESERISGKIMIYGIKVEVP